MSAELPLPPGLLGLYQDWQRIYLNFYQNLNGDADDPDQSAAALRGRVVQSGHLNALPTNWHSFLVQAEGKLLSAFHHWLKSAELFDLRAQIVRAVQELERADDEVYVVLNCYSLDLARLPWETWEIGMAASSAHQIRLVRSAPNIQAAPAQRSPRSAVRILAVLGDDSGLDFTREQQALGQLPPHLEIHWVGWRKSKSPETVKTEIRQALGDPQGWDILFFAGHSNEARDMGGELAIAPHTSIFLSEIRHDLQYAREQGLQFALFNSCKGLDLGEALIDLGLNQVAIMREPIHNRVAGEFFTAFIRHLIDHRNVEECVRAAAEVLKTGKNLTYPSAFLIPSLFCHPGASLFRLPRRRTRWQQATQFVRESFPSHVAIALTAAVGISLFTPAQSFLRDQRLLVQAAYRQVTGQLPTVQQPPVLLVQIDDESIQRDTRLSNPKPLNRSYLADVVSQLTEAGAQNIGLDVLLDRQQPENDPILAARIRQVIQEHQTWITFAGRYTAQGEEGVNPQTRIAQPEWSMQGYVAYNAGYLMLPDPTEDCRITCPFAYLLTLVHTYRSNFSDVALIPQLSRQKSLRVDLIDQLEQLSSKDSRLRGLKTSRFHPMNIWAYQTLRQEWLGPVIDFSIPPDRVYQTIPAWQVLNSPEALRDLNLSQRLVIVGAGGYDEAGLSDGSDNFSVPPALQYWRSQSDSINTRMPLTGPEILAYMSDHLIHQRIVLKVPDLWLVAIAAIIGKILVSWLQYKSVTQKRRPYAIQLLQSPHGVVIGLAIASLSYGFLSLQVFISGAILLPWFVPTTFLWIYLLPTLRRTPHG